MSEILRSQDEADNPEKNPEKNLEYRGRLKVWDEWEKHFREVDIDGDEPMDFDEEESVTLDEKIRELVIGLNVIGIETHYSCEGHFTGFRI